jgi:hypothetical protein
MASDLGITALFFILILFNVIIIFVAVITFKKTNSLFLLFLIWIFVFGSIFAVKASAEKEIKNKDIVDTLISTFLSVFLIVGSTLLAAQPTIIGRAFENTVGYWWINNDTLATEMANVFNKPTNELDINLIVTQMFSSDDKQEFNDYIKNFNEANQFNGVTFKNVPTTNLYDNFVVKKNDVSKATLASLATIVALYTSYMPITTPWINNN